MENDNLNLKPEETRINTDLQQDDKSNEFSAESIFLMTFLGIGIVGFWYLVYLMIYYFIKNKMVMSRGSQK